MDNIFLIICILKIIIDSVLLYFLYFFHQNLKGIADALEQQLDLSGNEEDSDDEKSDSLNAFGNKLSNEISDSSKVEKPTSKINKKNKTNADKPKSILANPIVALVIIGVTLVYFASKFIGGDPLVEANKNAEKAVSDSSRYTSGENCVTSGLEIPTEKCGDDRICVQANIRRYINPCMQTLGAKDANLLKVPCGLNKQEFTARFCASIPNPLKKEECENLATLAQSKGQGAMCEKYHMKVFMEQANQNK